MAANRQHTGYVFILALVTLVVVFILGVTSVQVAVSDYRAAAHRRSNIVALELADAAVNMGTAYLRVQSMPPTGTVRYPSSGMLTVTNGSYYFTITPISNSENVWMRNYKIVGIGIEDGTNTQQQVTILLSPRSFSTYGYFEDLGVSGNYWVTDLSTFYGPFHSNGNNGTRKVNIVWKKNDTRDPYSSSYPFIFHGTASTACADMAWGTSGKPATDKQWHQIFAGGQSAFQPNADIVPFPTVADEQRDAAWGATTNHPANTDAAAGVYINSDISSAGIFINSRGKAVQTTFAVTAEGYQQVSIAHQIKIGSSWKNKITELTINLENNRTSVRTKTDTAAFTDPSIYAGVPNGVLYCTGAMSVEGLLADSYVANNKIVRPNNWTVATNFASGADVTITNNLAYQHEPTLTLPMTDPLNLRCPALGIVADQILIKPNIVADDNFDHVAHPPYYPESARRSLTPPLAYPNSHYTDDLIVNGVMMAMSSSSSGSIRVKDIDEKRLMGAISILGGSVVKTAAILGHFDQQTNLTTFGYDEKYSYDPRMAEGPLTAFPRTNQYNIVYWHSP